MCSAFNDMQLNLPSDFGGCGCSINLLAMLMDFAFVLAFVVSSLPQQCIVVLDES
ncbi:hypothetical protein M431DRAFT_509562 [Trichoderma harzianum CBS 226.95]|uniref:Uncharacterized protein n=1 Tax=Trichoderma harzianum CBS 226.95 TaxID=983964 RepID=A0A2T4A891_TRIHA|nr:hypothetical protein M431DRAFT_509562 [Trichoderma harzianum CBS 226.95]PTB53262.1 hypothetical protein M431DRAFT_509562 [Trichoderma harzianum CBS 226.95]